MEAAHIWEAQLLPHPPAPSSQPFCGVWDICSKGQEKPRDRQTDGAIMAGDRQSHGSEEPERQQAELQSPLWRDQEPGRGGGGVCLP